MEGLERRGEEEEIAGNLVGSPSSAAMVSEIERERRKSSASLAGEDEIKSGEGDSSSRRRRESNYHVRLIAVN